MLKINAYYSLFIAIALFSNNRPLLSSQNFIQNDLKRTCTGLGKYYRQMKRSNYYDKNGVGLFTKWFKNEEMEIDEMDEELQDDNVDDCGYLDFDDNFPLDPSIKDKDKQSKTFEIIQYCYRNGRPPSNKKGKEKENSNKKSNKNSGSYDDGSQVNKSFTVDSYWKQISPKKLDKAIKEGKLEVLKYWGVEAIKNVKVLPSRNALHTACEYGKLHIVKWLINECGFSLEETDNALRCEKTAFGYAVEGGSIEVLEFLKGKKAKMNVIAGCSNNNPLFLACRAYDTSVLNYKNDDDKKDKIEVIKWLINHSNRTKGSDFYINLEFTIQIGTPFLWAAERGLLAITQLLREKGANVDAKDSSGNNALHKACLWSESEEMVTWLLDVCKIGLETKGHYQRTPFLWAAERGLLAITQLLREKGANVDAKDSSGNNALHKACLWSESEEMVTWLLDVCKIGIETKGCDEKTPLLCAARGESTEIVSLLIEKGANINAEDKDGKNALYYANMCPKNLHYIFRTLQ